MAFGAALPAAGRAMPRPARRRRSLLALLSTRGMHEPDYGLLVTLAALVVFGTVMIFSATFAIYLPDGGGGTFYFLKKQVGWLLLGGFGFLVMSRIDYHFWRAYSIPALAGALGLLMLVMVPGLGVAGGGAHRWLNLGPIPQFQPSELAKMALILYLADWLTKRGPRLGTWLLGVMPFSVILGGMIFLVMLEPDLGTSFLLAIIGITMLLVAGANLRQFALYIGLGAAAFMVLALGATYRRERLALFMKSDQELYLIDGGWQLIQARLSFGSGGFFGVGLGASRLKYGWLPAAHTDAIFAVIGEELGFLGCAFLLGLFLILAIRGYRVVLRAADPFGALLATGIVSWIVFQAMINLGGITTAIPFTGVPLPFVSYGGTSLCVVMAAAGVLVNISRQTTEVGSGKSEVGRKKRRARAQAVPGKTTIN
ncbi:MAG: putative lipid II flippase FtsW [Chloroflexia bacterium]